MKELRFPLLAALVALAIVSLNACAQNKPETSALDAQRAAFLEQTIPDARSFSGSYLAGRFAQRHQDWNAAQNYMNTVLSKDNENDLLMQRTFLLSLGAGNYAKAKDLADKILARNDKDEISLIFLASDALTKNNFAVALAHLNKLSDDGFGAYTKPLLTAWALVGIGRRDEALALLQQNSSDTDPTYHIHAGLIEEMAGNTKAAGEHYKVAMANGLTLHSAVLVEDFFSRNGQPEIADTINASLAKLYPFNPFVAALAHQDPKRHIDNNISRAADGAGFAIYDLATMLYEKHAYDSAQIYSSIVQMLTPSSAFAMLMSGDISALQKQFPRAVASYNAIPEGTPLYWLSRMRVAEVYEISGHMDMAVNLLGELAKYEPTRTDALVTIGDIYRRHEDFAHAYTAYDAALASVGTVTAEHWSIIYARGMSSERMNNWPLAEKDLLKALDFQPDNPQILNFIGYSWINKGINTDKAMSYIGKAVALKPDDGYILDSYGWAFYRTGQYDNAIKWMEQAVQVVPDNSTILDHLGDAYWQVGRVTEARFKWQRAEELSEDNAFRTTLEGKIAHGVSTQPLPVKAAAPAAPAKQKEAKL